MTIVKYNMQMDAADHVDIYGSIHSCVLKCISLPYGSHLHQGEPSNPAETGTKNLIVSHLHQKERMLDTVLLEFQLIFGCFLCACDKSHCYFTSKKHNKQD
jgi:hypothetical protein